MREIGGYFEIEFPESGDVAFHKNALRLNTARNSLEYILRARSVSKIFVPYYTCDAILEPIERLGITFEFYKIDERLEIKSENMPVPNTGEVLLYTNYFGTKGRYIEKLAGTIGAQLVIDNSQALFEKPMEGIPTFYSLRKFAGVADGAFLYTSDYLDEEIPFADSSSRVSHLYKRKDVNATAGYELFRQNDAELSGLPIERMSASTKAFVRGYNFEKNRQQRERNFEYVHVHLGRYNELQIDNTNLTGPLCYPFLPAANRIKEKLIARKIYVPTYWPNVIGWINGESSVERQLVDRLLPLPIDQRLSTEDLDYLIRCILDEL